MSEYVRVALPGRGTLPALVVSLLCLSCLPAPIEVDGAATIASHDRTVIVPSTMIDDAIATSFACWPPSQSRPESAWKPPAGLVRRVTAELAPLVDSALTARGTHIRAPEYFYQVFGVVLNDQRQIVVIGVHEELLSDVMLGADATDSDRLRFLARGPFMACDAGALQFLISFDADGKLVHHPAFFPGLQGHSK